MTLPQKLERLSEGGEPLRLKYFDLDLVLALRTDLIETYQIDADFTEEPDWSVAWLIIGALVSHAVDRGDLHGRDELLDAAKVGLGEVLDVRLRQVEITAEDARGTHLAWCKTRALEYLDSSRPTAACIAEAFASLLSDLRKHPGTASHLGIDLVTQELLAGFITTREQARRHIEGFN